jgi:pimeloyl-ACP methyl ester carboxylesterase
MDRYGQTAYLCRWQKPSVIMICSKMFPYPALGQLAVTVLAAGSLAIASAGADDEGDGEPGAGDIELNPCELTLAGTGLTAEAECGFMEVAENPAEPDGRRIMLHLARVPATSRSVEPDPLFLFAGGPGQAATESWLAVAGALRKVNETRDVILIDQRGTGQSNALKCPKAELEASLVIDWDDLKEATIECLNGLDGDPRYYTTTIAMGDYNEVRKALGYEQINLFGVSYGTRAAQVYLRQFPDTVRTVVLDSVVPQTLALGSEHAQVLDDAVSRILQACDADSDCHEVFPGTPGLLLELMASLKDEPREVTFPHPYTGKPETITFDRDVLGSSIRFLAYSSATQAMLPLLIHEAATSGNLQRLASQVMMVAGSLQEMISSGMEMSVMCAEDYPQFPPIDLDSPEPEDSLMGNMMLKATQVRCSVWPRGERPDDFHTALVSDKPVLLLSGEFDPVTPPRYADEVASHMPNSLSLVAPGQGHSVLGQGCIGSIMTDFVNRASVEELETDCIDQLQSSPFFVGLTGPKP